MRRVFQVSLMRRVFQVSLMIAVAFIAVAFLISPALAAKDGILVDKASVSKGFSAASTYVQIAAATTLIDPILGPDLDPNDAQWPTSIKECNPQGTDEGPFCTE